MPFLPDAESFKRLADGTDRRFRATLLRGALAPLGAVWSMAMAARNTAYERGLFAAHRAPVPVVCVGNLTLGGTGKTPLVAWVARRLAAAGHRPAIVSRGYGAGPGQRSDEAAELAIVLPGVPHVADRDRVAGARAAAAAGAGAVILDDGFQHRRLARDLDLVAIDATDPFGCGRVFPRGLLRERLAGAARADALILTRAASVTGPRRAEIRARLAGSCAGRPPPVWAEASHAPTAIRSCDGGVHPLDWLAGRRVAAFAGIGNPAAFRKTLDDLAADVVAFRPYVDHHDYSAADHADLVAWGGAQGADVLVTTLKDLVKLSALPPTRGDAMPLVAVEIALMIESGADDLGRLVDSIASRSPPPRDRRGESGGVAR